MSIIMDLKDVKNCPACSFENIRHVEVVDKNYGEKNKLSRADVDAIAEDGLFEFEACTRCGFKWIKNTSVASTSQLKAWLCTFFSKKAQHTSISDLSDWVKQDIYLRNIVEVDSIVKSSPPTDVKTDILASIFDHLESCAAEDLLDIYNNFSINSYEQIADGDLIIDD